MDRRFVQELSLFSLYHAAMTHNPPRPFTPALGRSELIESYDGVMAVTVREKRLRSSLLRQIAPRAEEPIIDIGSGTGIFNLVRTLDGYENMKANKDGMIPLFIAECGFVNVHELATVATPTGSISIQRATKPLSA